MTSVNPPSLTAMIGQPAAIASKTTIPKGSLIGENKNADDLASKL